MLFKYLLVGGTAAAVDITIFFVFAKLVGFNYLSIGAVGFIAATFVNYLLSVRFVFESGIKFSKKEELALVYIASSMGLAINLGILYLCIEIAMIETMTSKLIATASVFFWNFFSRKQLIFKGE